MQEPTYDEKADDEKWASLHKELESVVRHSCKLEDQIDELRQRMETKPKFPFPLLLPVRAGSSKKGQAEETDLRSLTLLEHEYKDLEEKRIEIENQIDVILQRKQKDDKIAERIPELIVIAFVNEIEKADQYFDFKDFLSKNHDGIEYDCIPNEVVKKLVADEELKHVFNKLDEEFIGHAVNALILELKIEHRHVQHSKHIEYLKTFDYEGWNTTKDCEQMTLMWPYLDLEGPKEKDIFASIHPICKLVFDTREKRNVMDEEPNVELEKIFNLDPTFFEYFIMFRYPKAEFKKIMSSCEGMTYEKAKDVIRTLHDQALHKYNAFRSKYSQQPLEPSSKKAKYSQQQADQALFRSKYSQQPSGPSS